MIQRPQSLPSRSLYNAININSMEICQDKKIETNLCQVLPKQNNNNKKTDKRNQLFTWATFTGNPNSRWFSLLNLRIVSKSYLRTDSARLCRRKHVAFQSHPVCFYFKGKFWEVNITKGVVDRIEECSPNTQVAEGPPGT